MKLPGMKTNDVLSYNDVLSLTGFVNMSEKPTVKQTSEAITAKIKSLKENISFLEQMQEKLTKGV